MGNVIKDFFIKIEQIIWSIIFYSIDFVRDQGAGLSKFILEKNVVQIGIGIILASQITKFTTNFAEIVTTPLIQIITGNQIKKLEDYKLIIFGFEFKIGLLLISLINFFITLIIIYYIWKFSSISNFSFIPKAIDKFKEEKLGTYLVTTNTTSNN